jgi:hypothetical protein
MKKLTFILFLLVTMLAVVSCPDDSEDPEGNQGETKFWAQNMVTNAFYQLGADKLAEGSRCEVWAERGSGVTAATAQNIANEYDSKIYPKIMDTFGWQDDIPLTNGQTMRMNTMEFAHALATGKNGAKLTILLLDIRDGYQPGVNESYVAGYFWLYNFFSTTNVPQGYKTNVLDMIYIDTNPGLNNEAGMNEAYKTLAHEMQHLMNFVSSYRYRVYNNTIYTMDTWIDEGLSSAAEWVYSGVHLTSRIGWYNLNGNGEKMKGKIDEGNNFYVWGNRITNSEPYPVLDDYATVYLFFQWLRLQSNDSIYKEIIKTEYPYYDQRAVINAFNAKKTSGSNYSNWESMLRDWLAANNINSPSGRDGYKNDSTLKDIRASYAPTTSTTLGLYPGEGVYSYSSAAVSPPAQNHIKYEYLSNTKTLLTYNSNPVNYIKDVSIDTLIENGTTTGSKPPASIIISGNFNIKLGSSKISGPFPIGMGDVIRMNNNGNRINVNGLPLERVHIDE